MLYRETLPVPEYRHPLPDASAETVVLNMVLHHAAQPAQVFGEIYRVLRPRGKTLVIADLLRHELEWARERMADQWLGFEREELSLCSAAPVSRS